MLIILALISVSEIPIDVKKFQYSLSCELGNPIPSSSFMFSKIILDELLITKGEILLLGNDREFADIIGWDNYYDWIEKRSSKLIPFREVTFPFPEYEIYKEKNIQQLRKTKFLPLVQQKPGSVIINDKLISIWNPIHPRVIVIEGTVLNQFLKSIFEIIWEKY